MDPNSQNQSEKFEEILFFFNSTLTLVLQNQKHLELSLMQLIKEQERNFDSIRRLISDITKENFEEWYPPSTSNQENEDWEVINKSTLEEEGWVKVPKDV